MLFVAVFGAALNAAFCKAALIGSVVVVIADVIFAYGFYRCPYCGAVLNWRGKEPQYCPDCGEKLD